MKEQQTTDWVFAPEVSSIAQARTLVAQALHGLPPEALEVVMLLTSELVTNAVRHGRGLLHEPVTGWVRLPERQVWS